MPPIFVARSLLYKVTFMNKDKNRTSILYVDDEPNNLVTFKANFRNLYNVYTTNSVEEARTILESNEINVIITDQRMPEISGTQFLESIIEDHPFPVRIILTGYSDMETVIEAINKGQVYRYIMKPMNTEEVRAIIESANDLYIFRRSSKDALLKYNYLFESSNDTVFIIDKTGRFKEINTCGLSLLKIKEDEVKTTDLEHVFLDKEEYQKLYTQMIVRESVIDMPVRLKKTNGDVIDALMSVSAITDKSQTIGFQGMIRDITRQKEIENLMIRTIIETQERERQRFGKNLHDGVGSMLAAIKMMLQGMAAKEKEMVDNPNYEKIQQALNSTIVELRNVCFNIMPPSLEVLGLQAAVKDLCGQHSGALYVNFSVNFSEEFPPLNKHLELAIFRIVQEFINNAVTHGKAREIRMDFNFINGTLDIMLSDNGIGFNTSAHNVGLGMRNIKSRIQSYNGRVDVRSNLAVGTNYHIVMPYMGPDDEAVLI